MLRKHLLAGWLAGGVSDSLMEESVSHWKCLTAAQKSRARAGRSWQETMWHRAPDERCKAEIHPRHWEHRTELDMASASWSSLSIVGGGVGTDLGGPV